MDRCRRNREPYECLRSKGTLQLQFVDRSTNKIVWNGMVSEKLDVENKKESLDKIYKAIAKLIKEFPPKVAK